MASASANCIDWNDSCISSLCPDTIAEMPSGIGVRLHQVDGSAQPKLLEGTEEAGSYAVTFSPDGKKILTVSRRTLPSIWDAETGTVLTTLEKHNQ